LSEVGNFTKYNNVQKRN